MDITHIVVYVLGILFSLLLLTLFASYLIFRARQNSNFNQSTHDGNIPGIRSTLRASPEIIYPVPWTENNIAAKANHNLNNYYIAGFYKTNGNGNGNGYRNFNGNGNDHYNGNGQR